MPKFYSNLRAYSSRLPGPVLLGHGLPPIASSTTASSSSRRLSFCFRAISSFALVTVGAISALMKDMARCEKVYWVGPKSHLAMSFINAEIAPTVTRANDEMARMQNERLRELEEAVVEEAMGGNPWPRRTGPGSREE